MTGFSPEVCALIDARSGGICELCGARVATERHHRRPRGAGSTHRWSTNQAANSVHTCRDCHRLVESHRRLAIVCGWLVGQAIEPASVAVIYRGELAYLTDDGAVKLDTAARSW